VSGPSVSPPDPQLEQKPSGEEPPPILGSWARLYVLEFLNLALLVVLFYLLTKSFE
jgi:hypothetical protein